METTDKDLIWLANVCQGWNVGESRTTPLKQLAEFIGVTTRTTQHWLKRMDAGDWLQWSTYRGRGRLPSLTLKKDVVMTLEQRALLLMQKGYSDRALMLFPHADKSGLLKAFFAEQPNINSAHTKTLYVPFYRPVHDLDPQTASRRTEGHLLNHIHRGLVYFNEYECTIEPAIAHHWEQVGASYTFYLRKNVLFHNGKRVEAADVKKAFLRLKRINHPHAIHAQLIKQITVDSSHQLTIELHQPNSLFINLLAINCFAVALFTKGKIDPIGCGPFELTQRDNSRTVLAAFDQFYGTRPLIDEVEYWTLTDQSVHINVNAHVISRYVTRGETVPIQSIQQTEHGANWFCFNQKKRNSFFKTRQEREYFCGLLDLENLPAHPGENALPAVGLVPGRETSLSDFTASNASATALTKDPKINRPISLVTYEMNSHRMHAKWIQSSLAKYSVQVDIAVLSYPEFSRPGALDEYDIVFSGEVFNEDIALSYYQFFIGNTLFDSMLSEQTASSYNQPITKMKTNTDPLEAMHQVEDNHLSDFAMFPVSHVQRMVSMSTRLDDLRINAFGLMDFNRVWLRG